jgi:hypothetical protein
MSDVSVAAEQDSVAESLLGEPQELATQDNGAEEQVAQPEEQLVEEQSAEPEVEEAADDWLPTEQEKVFPDDVLRSYAESRYPEILRLLDNDPTNGQLRQLLHDKLNTDIYLRQQQEQEQLEPEQFEEETAAEPTQQQTQPQVTREQYFQNLDRVVSERTDPEVAKAFHGEFLKAFGVPDAEIAKMPPEQAMRFTNTASKYMLNLMNTFMPEMLSARFGDQVEQQFPGFGEMYQKASYARAWDNVRNSNPAYAELPAYGSKEFSKTLREAQQKFPELVDAFLDEKGEVPMKHSEKAYGLLARIASGQIPDPKLVQQAALSGARAQRRADVRRSAANLGSGQSKAGSQRTGARFQTNDDIFDDETMALYQREHGRL